MSITFAGPCLSGGGVGLLNRMGVRTLLDLRSKYDHTDEIGVEAERLGLRYYWLPMGVWDPPPDEKTEEFISVVTDDHFSPFFVFCQDGVNRTGMMTAIYRIHHDKWAVESALNEMDEVGFSPYYWSLRNYVWVYYRKLHPESSPPAGRR